jgi:hypothetical protein
VPALGQASEGVLSDLFAGLEVAYQQAGQADYPGVVAPVDVVEVELGGDVGRRLVHHSHHAPSRFSTHPGLYLLSRLSARIGLQDRATKCSRREEMSLGGELAWGPAITYTDTTWYFAVTPGGELFYNQAGDGNPPAGFVVATPPPRSPRRGADPALACQGTDGQLWAGSGMNFLSRTPEGGALVDGPGLAFGSGGTLLYFAEGTDHSVWVKQPPDGSWTSLGGDVVGGVGAVGVN